MSEQFSDDETQKNKMKNISQVEDNIYIIHDEIMGLYIVMREKEGKRIKIAHFLTKEDAENFLS